MGKIYKIVALKSGKEIKTLQEASHQANTRGDGILQVPAGALCLNVEGAGGKIELAPDGGAK